MKTNYFSITFWFNIFNNHSGVLAILQNELKDEYEKFSVFNYTENLAAPIITAINDKKMTNIAFSQINLQYNMDKVVFDDLGEFKEKCLKLFDILISMGIKVLRTSIFVNGEIVDDEALQTIAKNTISSKLCNNDLVDVTLKLGKKQEDLFYKTISIVNKKQIKLPQIIDEEGHEMPIPLIPWNGALVENEIIDISYEINDKYSYDFTKNYHTTEFYLNKMLYLLSENILADVKTILEKGKF